MIGQCTGETRHEQGVSIAGFRQNIGPCIQAQRRVLIGLDMDFLPEQNVTVKRHRVQLCGQQLEQGTVAGSQCGFP